MLCKKFLVFKREISNLTDEKDLEDRVILFRRGLRPRNCYSCYSRFVCNKVLVMDEYFPYMENFCIQINWKFSTKKYKYVLYVIKEVPNLK